MVTGALTRRQAEILDFIRSFIPEYKMPPTVREIGGAFGIAPPSVLMHLRALERKGRIRRTARRARSIELIGDAPPPASGVRRIPIIGEVAAGRPIFAEEYHEGHVTMDGKGLPKGFLYALRVDGDSMKGAGIMDGDLVVALSTEEAHDGNIVVALIGDEAVVKRFRRRGGAWQLESENPKYRPIPIQREDVRIQGKVVAVQRVFA